MRRCIGFLISLVLIMSTMHAWAEESKTIRVKNAGAVEFTASEWMRTEETRALLTVLIAIDHFLEEEDYRILLALGEETYIGKADDMFGTGAEVVLISYFVDNLEFLICYDTVEKTATFGEPFENSTEQSMNLLYDIMCSEYYMNAESAIYEMALLLENVMNENVTDIEPWNSL